MHATVPQMLRGYHNKLHCRNDLIKLLKFRFLFVLHYNSVRQSIINSIHQDGHSTLTLYEPRICCSSEACWVC